MAFLAIGYYLKHGFEVIPAALADENNFKFIFDFSHLAQPTENLQWISWALFNFSLKYFAMDQ